MPDAVTLTPPAIDDAPQPRTSGRPGARGHDDVARFAGGVAHDVNNMLSAIRGFAVLAQAELEPDGPGVAELDEVVAATDRAAALVRELLATSTARDRALRPIAPGVQATRLAPMLRLLLGDSVALAIDDRTEGALVRADAAQLDQVFVNLALNARAAMPAGGRLGIRLWCLASDGALRIEIADTGVGMDAATAARAFEPYFTTRAGAGATGLGLANVLEFVRATGGTIGVQSVPGAGTTFRIDLPLAGGA
jgi:two-component system cell cycle sensor histidine kinase/response regulator CckA